MLNYFKGSNAYDRWQKYKGDVLFDNNKMHSGVDMLFNYDPFLR